jgi:hypothetical protein
MNENAGSLHLCHRCGNTATVQWRRNATEAEAEAWWDHLEQQIRQANQGLPGAQAPYTADRTDTVTTAVHGCRQHPVPDMHLTHDADCGGHGACGCELVAPEIAPGDLFEEAAP